MVQHVVLVSPFMVVFWGVGVFYVRLDYHFLGEIISICWKGEMTTKRFFDLKRGAHRIH